MKHVDFLLGKQVKEGNVNALVISESNLHKLHKSFPDVQCRIPGFANPFVLVISAIKLHKLHKSFPEV